MFHFPIGTGVQLLTGDHLRLLYSQESMESISSRFILFAPHLEFPSGLKSRAEDNEDATMPLNSKRIKRARLQRHTDCD